MSRALLSPPPLAVVVPFFNEGKNVDLLATELRTVLNEADLEAEIILVNDGSSDDTGARLDTVAREWPSCRIVHLARNQGQSAALLAGFAATTAPIIVTMDGDAQNDPEDIPFFLSRLGDADMVVGIRQQRQDSWARRNISWMANLVRSRALHDGVSDAGCALKVFRREVLQAFIPIRTLYSFMPALAAAAGFRVIETACHHRVRPHGISRYPTSNFLLLPIIDFVGVAWYCARRVRGRISSDAPPRAKDAAFDPGYFRSRALFGVGTAATLLLLVAILRPWMTATNFHGQTLTLSQAEKIALRHVPGGVLGSDEHLRVNKGDLQWMIDVQLPRSRNFREVVINGRTGHVLSTREETPEEDAFEQAVEEHEIGPGHLARD